MSKARPIEHGFAGESFRSEWVPADGEPRATIIVFPTVAGISELETGFAGTLAAKGFNLFLADLYGAEYRGAPREVGGQQMRRLAADRPGLRDRLTAVLDVVRTLDEDLGQGIVAIGFCFGGLCALDLARSGADVAAVASFHGLFDPPQLAPGPIKAKVIAFHGWDDPMVPPAKVVALARELTAAGCDWQIHAFGHTVHGFTNRNADKIGNPAVRFSEDASRRSWRALDGLLDELFPADG
jgi:dienelactone hydrolase